MTSRPRPRSLLGRARAAAGAAAILLGPGIGEAAAQCAMCVQAAQNAGDPETASRTFATAILVLLVPTVGLLGGAGVLLWKFRGDGGGPGRREDPPSRADRAESRMDGGRARVVPLRPRKRGDRPGP